MMRQTAIPSVGWPLSISIAMLGRLSPRFPDGSDGFAVDSASLMKPGLMAEVSTGDGMEGA